MKLNRHDLVHATNVQLRSIGLEREKNPGWLLRACAAEFTEAQVKLFHSGAPPDKVVHERPKTVWKMVITGPEGMRLTVETNSRKDLFAEMNRITAGTVEMPCIG